MRYDKAWLESVHSTRTLISQVDELITSVPDFNDRAVMRLQYGAMRDEFEGQLARGYDISHARRGLVDLAALSWELIEAG